MSQRKGREMSPSKESVEIRLQMDLRDYFAAKAMQSMYKIYYNMFLEGTFEDWHTEGMLSVAEDAYFMADAMLKER